MPFGWIKPRFTTKSRESSKHYKASRPVASECVASGSVDSGSAADKNGFGLHILYDSTKANEQPLPSHLSPDTDICYEEVDIIAIHGLGGRPFDTWTHPKTKNMWLRDLLPLTMTNSRIMTYGYDAGVYKNKGTLRILDNAENLLFSILNTRKTDQNRSRGIVFVGHSMGGIVVKKALVMASEEQRYKNIVESTRGVMFMGTPHDGADAAKLALTIANIANSVTSINTVNLELLGRDSEPLTEIARSFGFLAQRLKIVTIVESNTTRIPIMDADHHLVCKFTGGDSLEYRKVRNAIELLATSRDASQDRLPRLQIPFSPDPEFVGRESVLRELHQKVSLSNIHSRHALYGLGGVGKSSIAIEYAVQLNRLQPSTWIFWVHGANSRRFKQSYREIANSLELPGRDNPQVNVVELVVQWLRNEKNGKWVMILDNADNENLYFPKTECSPQEREGMEPSEALSAYLPQSRHGCILVTSRDRLTAMEMVFNRSRNITMIEPMDEETAQSLVKKRLSAEQMDGANLITFIEMLGHIPLAITQACAYLEHSAFDESTPMTIAEYEALFLETKSTQLYLLKTDRSDARRDTELPSSVVTTWQISFEQIKREDPLAADILSLIGVLDRQGIPKSLLSLDDNSAKTREALSRLLAFCLIKAEKGNESFEMHHLVQLSLRAWLDDRSETTKWICKGIEILYEAFPKDAFFTPTNWLECSQYLPHTHALLLSNILTTKIEESDIDMKTKAVVHTTRLLNYVGNYLDTQGLFEDALCQHRRAYEIMAKFCGPEHKDTLMHYSNVAQTLSEQGKPAEAEAIEREILRTLSNTLPDAQDDGLHSLSVLVHANLARSLHRQGKYAEAYSIDEYVLKERRVKPGTENRDLWISMNAVAQSLATDGQLEEAEAVSRDVVAKQTAGLGPGNTFTFESRRGLASILVLREDFKEAEVEIRNLIDMEGNVLPEGHPERMRSAKILAGILCKKMQFSDAEDVLRDAQRCGAGFSSEPTLLMANLEAELAGTLLQQERYDEAIKLYRASLSVRDKLLPTRDLTTYNLTANLATALGLAGRITEQQDMLWETLQALTQLSDLNMRPVLDALVTLASSFGVIIDPKNVPDACTRILKSQPSQISDNWEVFKPRVASLSCVLLGLRMKTEGLELSVRFRKRPDLSTIQPIMALIEIYKASGRFRDVVPLVQELVEDFTQLLGPQHPLTTMHVSLLSVMRDSDSEEAEKLAKSAASLSEELGNTELSGNISRDLDNVLALLGKQEETQK
ncbi:hypothetical protein V499_05575 [Pseudogymnoascus sp. VKM F-103]|nr:hypothetical protein V499_05575 [Pseudogymnoascus sp. VKM F-103]